MSQTIHIYATKADLLPVLVAVEAQQPVQYVLTGNFSHRPRKRYATATAIPSLDRADSDTGSTCRSYLVADSHQEIAVRTLNGVGGTRFLIDQLENPDTIVIQPGGFWTDGSLLSGDIGTASDSAVSTTLMKRVASVLKKSFTKIKAYYVGTEALSLLRTGRRLTPSAQSTGRLDLREL